MGKIDYITGMIRFNMRVLNNGWVGNTTNICDLKNKLFFNKIFISNTDELFEKYAKDISTAKLYYPLINRVTKNISDIIKQLMNISDIEFSKDDPFEKRYEIHSKLVDSVVTKLYSNIDLLKFDFKSNGLYFISSMNDGTIAVSVVDSNRDIWKGIRIGNKFWKTDECIRDYINDSLNAKCTITAKVTLDRKTGNITKVEYSGDGIENFSRMFKNAFIIKNELLYTDDIVNVMNSMIDHKSEIQENFEITDLSFNDELIEYPNEEFQRYLNFIEKLVKYNSTEKIYLTLYRLGKDKRLFNLLKKAVEKGIEVHVNIEMRASGEVINNFWKSELRNIGVHVTCYKEGIYKVHSKLTLGIFHNGTGVVQIGTGNYNKSTSSQYTDLSYLTTDKKICEGALNVFKLFEGKDRTKFNSDFLVTKFNARKVINKLIDREGSKGSNGFICIKCNTLSDDETIKHLKAAAKNGCHIILLVRGYCSWIPSGNVKVKSTIWDKLEHSRVYSFGNINPDTYIGSLDLVESKMNKRIETMIKVKDPSVLNKLCGYLNRYINDRDHSYLMRENGSYVKIKR